MTDANGNSWAIPVTVANGGTYGGGRVFFQSTQLPATSGATELAYVNGVMWYQQNGSSTGWYSFNSSGVITAGPTQARSTFCQDRYRAALAGIDDLLEVLAIPQR